MGYRAIERLISLEREFLDTRAMRASTEEEKVARCSRPRVYCVTGCLQRVEHVVTLSTSQRVLHLVNDKHHICFSLVDKLRERMGKAYSSLLAYVRELKAEFEACDASLNAGNSSQFLENS